MNVGQGAMSSILSTSDPDDRAPDIDSISNDAMQMSQFTLLNSKSSTASPHSVRRRGFPKPAPPIPMKRAVSTPNVRAALNGDAASVSAAEKRRNKLGYHRTSVACGHCRRRKIRCLLAPEDPHGKCANCIRLKKDCNFFPVDQHIVPDRRPRTGSKLEASSGDAAGSDSSSPGYASGRAVEQVDIPHHTLQPAHMIGRRPAMPGMSFFEAPLTTSSGKDPLAVHSFEFPQSLESNGSWNSSFLHQNPQTVHVEKMPSEEMAYWRPHDPATAASYPRSQYPMTPVSIAPSSQSSVDHFASYRPRNEQSWGPAQPLRSMSMTTAEELPLQYQSQFFNHTPVEFERTATSSSDRHPPSLSSTTQSTTSGSDLQLHPNLTSFHEHPGTNSHFELAPSWGSLAHSHSHHPHTSAPDGFVQGWYADPPRLAQVKEEETNPHFHHPIHTNYLPFQANSG